MAYPAKGQGTGAKDCERMRFGYNSIGIMRMPKKKLREEGWLRQILKMLENEKTCRSRSNKLFAPVKLVRS